MTCAIILAAGLSQRMGAPKLLLPFRDSTVIARVADAFLRAGVPNLLMVIRPGDDAIQSALEPRQILFVENRELAGDMLSSIRCAIRALPVEARTVVVGPGDQPALEPELVRQMLETFHQATKGLLVPVYGGRRGHPLVFSTRYCREILESFDGVGLRGLLDAHSSDLLEWPTANPAVLQDLDTPDDYRRALRQ